jgi:hypothetical protein
VAPPDYLAAVDLPFDPLRRRMADLVVEAIDDAYRRGGAARRTA